MKILEKISFLGITFFTYCLIGWIYEVLFTYHESHIFVNRGFLHGTYIPIYGFGAFILLISLQKIFQNKVYIKKVPITPLVIFILTFIITSVIEYSASYILEKYFNLVLWNYYGYRYNLNGRICLMTSTYFGIGGLIAFYIVQPLLNKFRTLLNDRITIILGLSAISIMVVDFIITLIYK